jgi:ribonucleoside-diphosphate reductase alpha chain
MFEPTGFGKGIFEKRYSLNGTESWPDASKRWASVVAACEDNGKVKQYTDLFYDIIVNGLFMPGGRICYAAGRPKGQLLNCFVTPTSDSREGWGQLSYDSLVISGTGGGVGTNYSPVRPRGTPIHGSAGTATGSVSLMEIVNSIGEVIRAGNGRRTALMMCLNHDHPDIPEFLDKKLSLDKLNNANVSVVFQNESPQAFLRKVERDEVHNFLWNGQVIGSMPARQLWQKILENAVQCGEPGILNGWLANQQNNLYYHKPLISTNPCGEIWLEAYGCCDLGAVVLPRFVKDGSLDRKLLARTITLAVRFLDNVLDVNTYPLKAIEENCKQVRRLGLGVMGLHDMLIRLGMKYTSDEAKEYVDNLFSFIKKKAYEASIYLAVEKGQFPALDRGKFVESGFCQEHLSEGMRERIMQNGMRNCATMTIAPTGTTSMSACVSPSLEPIPAVAYWRNYNDGDGKRRELVEHPLFTELKDTPMAKLFESAFDIPVKDHIEMQAICQRHVDNAISKTINLPRNYTGADLDPVLRKYVSQLKGVTLYRDGSRGDSPIESLSVEEALQLQSCPSGVCEV